MNTIVKMNFGSHLYGTATENSDRDYKGIFLPERRDILLGRIPKSLNYTSGDVNTKNGAEDVDEEMYSLHYFIDLACKGETVALDMLHAPHSALIESSKTWEILQANRTRFYTKNLKALVGYARKQAAKYGIKGSRLAAAKEVLELLKGQYPRKLKSIWNDLPENEHCRKLPPPDRPQVQHLLYEVCGKKLVSTSRIDYCVDILQDFVDKYGERARMAEASEGIDWKAVSHALRAGYQVRAILIEGGFEYPLKETDYIRAVKQGKLEYMPVAAVLEDLIDECEALSAASSLPKKVDRNFWDEWILSHLETVV